MKDCLYLVRAGKAVAENQESKISWHLKSKLTVLNIHLNQDCFRWFQKNSE